MFTQTTLTIWFIAVCVMLVIVNIDLYGLQRFYSIALPLALTVGE